ncbi:MAG: hypothetical protein Q9162_000852 [Coniocarpon cinnabarinum]
MRNPTPWLFNNTAIQSAQLPGHCTPVTPFLETVSTTFNTCLPTPLAFASTLVGTLSIFSWLFAQFPQIVRNYQNQSVAGLSIFFLTEWLLGDLSNLLGALLTNQATWQVIIGAYYCFVDVLLVSQWIWYEKLRHGKPLKRIWLPRRKKGKAVVDDAITQRRQMVGEITAQQQEELEEGGPVTITRRASAEPRDIPTSKALALGEDMFRIPVYGTMSPSTSLACSAANRTITRIQQGQSIPAASPRTVLLVTMIFAVVARASPMSKNTVHVYDIDETSRAFVVGEVLSWCSTILYLLSRLPQLIFNYRRKSTSGLSPTLFAAAFCGNLFYSTSLALNPNAWSSFEPYGGHGWADSSGSNRHEWVLAALPFFLGAAGVLGLDGAVGVQFWLYGEGANGQEQVVVVQERASAKEKAMRVRKVSGWMRGWQPSATGRISPVHGRRPTREEESEPLLQRNDEH